MFAENISESTSDLMFVEQWLRKCDQGHAGCLESASDELEARWRPSRLLKIEQVLPGKVSKLSICEDLSDSPVQYMTLSHCWGTSRPLQLVEKSLLLFRNCIPLSEVPKAFMEACEITLRLGVSFIWIDSLCIIQDSEEDWLRESSMMATIYSHSYLNLAAAHSAGSSDGLFSVRNPDAIGPWPIRSKDSDGSLKLFILQESDSLSLLQASRLNHRAWVLQEQVLAPRTLYFTSGTLIWQCEEICASEGRPNGFGSHPKIGCLKHDLMIIDKRTLEDDWFQYVRLFSEREITKNTDRLIAISAIAYRLMRQYQLTESDYLAGLWRPSMPLSLLWLSNKHNERLWTRPWKRYEKPVKYCAPSWSWASHNRGVYMINWGITVANALLIDVYITPVAEQLGSVRDGYLRIQGILVKIQLGFYRDGIRTRRHVGFELDETPVSGLSLYLDYDPSKGNSPVRIYLFLLNHVEASLGFLVIRVIRNVHANLDKLQVREHQRYDIYLFEIGRSPNQSTYSRGLVLEKEKVKGTYSRIGIYSKALQPDGPDSQPHRPSDYNLELDDFEESSGSDLYVIKII